MELTYSEIAEVLETRNSETSSTGYALPPGIYEVSDFNLMLISSIPDDVKVEIPIDDICLS